MAHTPLLKTAPRYSTLSIWLHWIIALMVLGNIAGAMIAASLGESGEAGKATAGQIMLVHKSIGLTVLGLSLIRLAWRLIHGTPALSPTLTRAERLLARIVHTLFYVLMIGVPLMGWIMSSGGPRPLLWFGLGFPKLPVERGSALADAAHSGHVVLGLSFLLLAALHIAGALKHHFVNRDGELARMLPFLAR